MNTTKKDIHDKCNSIIVTLDDILDLTKDIKEKLK